MLTEMNKIYIAKSKDLGDDQWKINFTNELIDVVHKTAECGLTLLLMPLSHQMKTAWR